jgi:RNA polymerase sigma factor (sigma-70 family)
MNPPPAEGIASRLFAGPALRTQPDRRLVTLVREGYETAFEEIVRRYGKPLSRYAAAIVGGRSEDVTQDAFSKALLALRRSDGTEIELRPWLYRIVRNTALNDLRDRPPAEAELAEAIQGGGSASEEFERREEMADLIRGLRALPEPQRAAIVMRELEGLSHEEIAAALGISGGGARQAIYRARQALRGSAGLAIPLPLLRMLIDHGAEAGIAGAGGAAVAAGTAGAGGAGSAIKIGLATVLVAGTVGTGVALDNHPHSARGSSGDTAEAAPPATGGDPDGAGGSPEAGAVGLDSTVGAGSDGSEGKGGSDRRGRGSGGGHGKPEEADDKGGLGSSGPGPGSGQHGGGPGGGQRHDSGEGHGGRGAPSPNQGSHSGPGPGGEGGGGPDGAESPSGGRGGGGGGPGPSSPSPETPPSPGGDGGGGQGGSDGSSSGPGPGVSGSGFSGSGSSGGSGSSAGSSGSGSESFP